MSSPPPSSLRLWDAGLTPAENARRDEELLRRAEPLVRTAVFSAAAVSLGVSQPIDAGAAVRARSRGLPVVRRSSGGSGLLHLAGDIAWAIVLPRDHPRVGSEFAGAYDHLGAGVVQALARLGLRAGWTAPLNRSDAYCLLGPRGRVLAVDGRAIGGAAQHRTRHALLHHGVLSTTLDRETLDALFALGTTLVDTSLTCLREQVVLSQPDAFARGLLDDLARSTFNTE